MGDKGGFEEEVLHFCIFFVDVGAVIDFGTVNREIHLEGSVRVIRLAGGSEVGKLAAEGL